MASSPTDYRDFPWTSAEGQAKIREIITARLPQWSTGPRDSQVECWAHNLMHIPTILVASTGWGKTAAFFGSILILQHLKDPKNRQVSEQVKLAPPPAHPVALVVTPLIELGKAHVRLPFVFFNSILCSCQLNKGSGNRGARYSIGRIE